METFFASCPLGAERILDQELEKLDIKNRVVRNGGVEFEDDDIKVIDAIFWSRVASRIYRKIHSFNLKADPKFIYSGAIDFLWQDIFTLKQTFKITTLLEGEASHAFKNSLFLSQKLKDAVVDHFKNKTGQRPNVDTKFPDIPLLLHIGPAKGEDNFTARIWVDLCGAPLGNRMYKSESGEAPLKENLAATLLLATDWQADKEILIDPMCGSGTILMEAALMQRKLPPQIIRIKNRHEKGWRGFSCEKTLWFSQQKRISNTFNSKIRSLYEDIRKNISNNDLPPLFGSDISQSAIGISKDLFDNFYNKGIKVNLNVHDATTLKPPATFESGVLILNPPYGERMGNPEEVKNLYHLFGENLKHNFKGYRAYIFTGAIEFRKVISLRTESRQIFHNGPMECRLFKYNLF